MDDLDARILVARLRSPFSGLAEVGRCVERSGTAVKQRLDRMRSEGVLEGFRLLPAAELFDRVPEALLFAPGDLTIPVSSLEDAVWSTVYDDGSCGVLRYVRPGPGGTGGADAVEGAEPLLRTPARLSPRRPRDAVISPLDWRILEACIPDATLPVTELALRSGLSRHTVQRRREALVERGLVSTVPLMHEGAVGGVVLYHRFAFGEAAARSVGDGHPYAWFDEPAGVASFHAARSIAAARAATEQVAAIPGVDLVLSKVPLRNAFAEARLLAWVAEERDRWRSAARAGAG